MLENTLGSHNCQEFAPCVMSDRSTVAVKKYKHRDRCRTFDQTRNCRFGDSCRYLHILESLPNVEVQHSEREVNISTNVVEKNQQNDQPVRKATRAPKPRQQSSKLVEKNQQDDGPVRETTRALNPRQQSRKFEKKQQNEGPVREPKPGQPKLCHSFAQTGRCRYGENCRYRHAVNPQDGGGGGGGRRSHNKRKDDDLRPNPNYENDSRLLCRVFARTGYCRYETSCRYAHLDAEAAERRARYLEEEAELLKGEPQPNLDPRSPKDGKIQPVKRSAVGRTKCRFFMAGHCKLNDRCKFLHPDIGVVKNLKEEDAEDGKGKPQAVVKPQLRGRAPVKAPLTRQMVHDIPELQPEDYTKLRDTEIQQLKKRFPKREDVKEGDDMQYKITFKPTDPDWAYDVKSVDLLVSFPTTYPTDRMHVRLAENDIIPGSVRRWINRAVDDWLTSRIAKWVKNDKVELSFRPFLKWLDKNLEEIFTDALKQYKRELLAKEAGLVFVPAAELKEKYAKLQSESDGENSDAERGDEEKPGDAEEEESDEEGDGDETRDGPIDPARRGTEVKLNNLQLKENAATLQPTNVKLIVQCNRCHSKTEFKTPVGQTSSIACVKCDYTQVVTFRGGLAHEFTNVIGYIDVVACSVFDLVLPETSFIAGCLGCNKDMKLEGLIPGQIKDTWCHHCHGKMRVGADNTRFLVLQAAEQITSKVVLVDNKKVKKVPKDPAIKDGLPLPNNGACKHYKKSYRWLRFPCCGKAYPCDVCHDENEGDHEMKYANRMICGYCCKEQSYSVEKPCTACGSLMTKKTGTHWEGGRGCRDKIKMSRNDDKKYANSSKTISRKSQINGTVGKKTTKLRHT